MRDGGETCQRPVEQLARRATLRVDDETDPARVALSREVIEQIGKTRTGWSSTGHSTGHLGREGTTMEKRSPALYVG